MYWIELAIMQLYLFRKQSDNYYMVKDVYLRAHVLMSFITGDAGHNFIIFSIKHRLIVGGGAQLLPSATKCRGCIYMASINSSTFGPFTPVDNNFTLSS